MGKIHIQIMMPHEKKLDDMVDSAILPGIEGDFEVLEGHTAFITKLRSGTLKIYKNGQPEYLAMHDGYVTVESDKILILSESCEKQEEIDLARAEKARERAEKRMTDTHEASTDFRRAESALKRAIARIEAVNTDHA